MEGCGTFVLPDGTKYVGRFHGGFIKGDGKITFSDGSVLDGAYSAEKDVAAYITASGERIVGHYEEPSPDLAHPHKPLDYPFWRALFHDSQSVYIVAAIDESGNVKSVALLQAIDSPSYTQAAIDGVMQWRYLPATIDGKPVKTLTLISIQFAQAH